MGSRQARLVSCGKAHRSGASALHPLDAEAPELIHSEHACKEVTDIRNMSVTLPRNNKRKPFTSSNPPPDADLSRRAIEVGVAKKVLIEGELRVGRGGVKRNQQKAIEVGDA